MIDGDILIYRAGFASQRTTYQYTHKSGRITEFKNITEFKSYQKKLGLKKEDGSLERIIAADPLNFAIHSLKLLYQSICKKFPDHEPMLFVGSVNKEDRSFRYEKAKLIPYKAGRPDKPLYFNELHAALVKMGGILSTNNLETDDMVVLEACRLPRQSYVIASIDKDLKQCPGTHYNFITGELVDISPQGYVELSEDRKKIKGGGRLWFWAQMLLGDSADNIPGIPGYGPVRVYNLLEPFQNTCYNELKVQQIVVEAYKNHYNEEWKQRFLEMADLLWMIQEEGVIGSMTVNVGEII